MNDQKKPPLVLVDGSSYLYRAFHALPPLTTKDGQPTGAIKGVTSMMRRLQLDYPGSPIVVIFDAKGKTFRDDIYTEYKANRPSMPDDLRMQVEPLHEMIRAMGFPLLVVPGVEADDVIGTLAHQSTLAGIDAVISTGDKDMAQLVTEHVSLVNTMTETYMDQAGVADKFGIGPELIIDYLALMGDKVDNIPGVPGVGQKTALALLQSIGGLNTLYESLDKIPELAIRGAKTLPKKLSENKELAYLSYELATIKLDVELSHAPGDFGLPLPDNEALLHWTRKFGFNRWTDELEAGGDTGTATVTPTPQTPALETHYETVLDQDHFNRWLDRLKAADTFAFDTETTSLNYTEADIVGVSFAVKAGEAAYVPVAHDYEDAPQQLDRDWVLEQLKPILEDENQKKLGQNLKYDRNVLLRAGIDLKGIAFDTMLESYVLNSTATRHDMDSLASKYLDHECIHYEDVAGKGVKQITFDKVPLEQASPYAAEDADITLRLHEALWPQLEAESEQLKRVLTDLELPLLPVISRLEMNGALVDADKLKAQSEILAVRMDELQQKAWELADEEFNLGSPKQLQTIFYEKLKLPVLKKTPKGAPSTAEPVLQELALDYPLPKVILEYRSLSKLKSTYTDRLPEQISSTTGRIHTSYHQAVTATGRLSSSDPNLQNIPIRTAEGRQVRQAFIAAPGYKLVAADYSQIELRIMAHLSGDAGLTGAFNNGQDVHKATASEVFSVGIEEVSTDQRRSAKAINFGLIYGMSAFGLGQQLGIGRNEAQDYIDRYFHKYPGVKEYMDRIRAQAAEDGYVETLLGRRLYLPEINARNKMRKNAAERTAINAPMQGTAADIIKSAMIKVDAWLAESKLDAKMIMQVHDELVFEVKEDQVDVLVEGVVERMSNALTLDVPLVVDTGVGNNWDEAH